MFNNNNDTATSNNQDTLSKPLYSTGNFGELLAFFGAAYKSESYYLQVGEITKVQGWILHLTVVISQVTDLFELVLPYLIREKVSFKIAMNIDACEDLLSGHHGLRQIGKLIKIYPENDFVALRLAKRLLQLTAIFKGPAIHTDYCLSNIVYTRYGSFSPVIKTDSSGNEEKYIYNSNGQLVRDEYSIPFIFPENICWPFSELVSPIITAQKKLLRHIYKPLSILKINPRGNVFKGIYLKSTFCVKKCVIKQGFKHMSSDINGRDIQDRLNWQCDVWKRLSGIIPMPAIFDKFQEEEGTYLIMEYINGTSLYEKILGLNPDSKSWQELEIQVKLKILNYLIITTSIINKLHQNGFVHRDVVPGNFLIDKNDKIFLIDNELVYSLSDNYPSPPFTLGTPGFISPEQQSQQTPTIQEDIYGIGATLLVAFTGLTPVRFNPKDSKKLLKNLFFFVGHQELSDIIAACLHNEPKKRPDIPTIIDVLVKYQTHLSSIKAKTNHPLSFEKLSSSELRQLILAALEGLTKPPIIYFNDRWYSENVHLENSLSLRNKEYTLFPGLVKGLGGILYLLARVQQSDISIAICKPAFRKSWEFIEETYFKNGAPLLPGLYTGFAGLALSLSNSIDSGLVADAPLTRERIKYCLEQPNSGLDLADGLTGQGVSVLQCRHYLPEYAFLELLNHIIGNILSKQQNDGSWAVQEPLSFGYGIPGIVWFLLDYISIYPDKKVQTAIGKALQWILKKERGQRGVLLTFIKAYATLCESIYKKRVESSLSKLSSRTVSIDFTQQSGLAGLGELYIEAAHTFNNQALEDRADWIANVFFHSFLNNDASSGHWLTDERNCPTADFMAGNCGIIHFLLRCFNPVIGYNLLK